MSEFCQFISEKLNLPHPVNLQSPPLVGQACLSVLLCCVQMFVESYSLATQNQIKTSIILENVVCNIFHSHFCVYNISTDARLFTIYYHQTSRFIVTGTTSSGIQSLIF